MRLPGIPRLVFREDNFTEFDEVVSRARSPELACGFVLQFRGNAGDVPILIKNVVAAGGLPLAADAEAGVLFNG